MGWTGMRLVCYRRDDLHIESEPRLLFPTSLSVDNYPPSAATAAPHGIEVVRVRVSIDGLVIAISCDQAHLE
jgi:hypothetical protein